MTIDRLKKHIEKAKSIHGDFYDYSKTNPFTVKEKAIIICPLHGEFETTLDSHINAKSGCPVCKKCKKYTNDEWINEANKRHHGKYDYSKTEYVKANKKVIVICHEKDEFGKEHGEFSIRAGNHMAGIGCPKCGGRYNMTGEEFILKARKKHGDKYDYSKTIFTKSTEKVDIVCHVKDKNGKEHGVFSQVASSHLQGCGCPKCNGGVLFDRDKFIELARKKHGDKYDYSNVEYKNERTKIAIKCPVHGSFLQTPYAHLKGQGCSCCKTSKCENEIMLMLSKNGIKFEFQSKILNLGLQTVDFYLPELGVIIECQGEQHFKPVRFSYSMSYKEAENNYYDRVKKDNEKYEASQKMGLTMVYFINNTEVCNEKTINKNQFYNGKILFDDIEKLYLFLDNREKNNTREKKCENRFMEDMTSILNGGYIKENSFEYGGFSIVFVPLEENKKRELYDKRRNYVKRGKKIIFVFEDEYENTPEIVFSKIKHICGLDGKKEKIYGRKTNIKPITKKEARPFLEKNHIQGFVQSSVYIGAFFNEELVGVMSFLNEGDGKWNLTRFATSNNYVFCGIGGKLFSFFKKNYIFKEVKTFADLRWTVESENNLYTKMGFKFKEKLKPNYYYILRGKTKVERLHKFGFRKKKLHKKYGLPLTMTEKEMCDKLGFYRIWDCGLLKFVYVNPDYVPENEETE